MDEIKISSLELENVKRVKAVALKPTESGLTVIGGKNNNGKTSVLDAIAWALGGNKFKPSKAKREGSVLDPYLKVTLSNGIVVERTGKNSTLKVIDPSGKKAGQKLLDSFISELALDLPKFMNANDSEKANILLNIIGVGDELASLEREEKQAYADRLAIGRIADSKEKYAKELETYSNVPDKPVSASELIMKQQEILARNGENQKKRERVKEYQQKNDILSERISTLNEQLAKLQDEYAANLNDLEIATQSAKNLVDESTEEIETSISEIDEINRKVRANLDHEKAIEEAHEYSRQYGLMTKKIEKIRSDKKKLLEGADLPLPELSVQDGMITYKGQLWDNMSGSEQLMVATAIVRKLNPSCGFVLMDKLEQMDMDTLNAFGRWLENEGLQAIATRVSTGDECSVIIEDGCIADNSEKENKEELKEDEWGGIKW